MVAFDFDSGHTVVVGRTRAGKTHFVREALYERTRLRAVFFNVQHERGFGPEITQWDRRLLVMPGAKVNYCPPVLSARDDGNAAMLEALAQIADDLIDAGSRGAKDDRAQVVVFVDEAHLVSPKASRDDPLIRLATNGARFGLRFCAITQRPALLSHTVLSQARTHVLFDLDDYERDYLDRYAVPDDVRAWIRTPLPGDAPGTPNRRFAVRQGTVWSLCRPV